MHVNLCNYFYKYAIDVMYVPQSSRDDEGFVECSLSATCFWLAQAGF